MIVIDASVVIDLLLRTGAWEAASVRIGRSVLHAPELLDLEVLHVLRRYRLTEGLTPARAMIAIADLADLRIERHRHGLIRSRVWELHQNLTAYDAAYVALAEALRAPLITRDAKLAKSSGHAARIELI